MLQDKEDYPFSFDVLARFTIPVGLIIGGVLSILAIFLSVLHVPAAISAGFILLTSIILTSGQHEQNLADLADSIHGDSPEQRFVLLGEKGLGTYGVIALVLSMIIRWQALSLVVDYGLAATIGVILASSALSRALSLVPFALLPYAPNAPKLEGELAKTEIPSHLLYVLLIAGFCVAAFFLAPALSFHAFIILAVALSALVFALTTIAKNYFGGTFLPFIGASFVVIDLVILAISVSFLD